MLYNLVKFLMKGDFIEEFSALMMSTSEPRAPESSSPSYDYTFDYTFGIVDHVWRL